MRKCGVFATLMVGVFLTGVIAPKPAAAYKAKDLDEPVHEYMVDVAKGLGAHGPELLAYMPLIIDGASHEDVFDHIYDRTGACVTITHFWDPDNGTDTKNSKVWTVFCEEWNAWLKARQLWGMALGEYYSGDFSSAYEYLGHVAHLLGDLTVPAHAHEDSHVYPDEYDDNFMTEDKARLTVGPGGEFAALVAAGPVVIPKGVPELYWLFYTTAQVGDFYASDDDDGDSDDPQQWCADIFAHLDNNAECREAGNPEDGDCDLEIIRANAYFYGIRAIAGLYDLFEKTVKKQTELTVVIDAVAQIDGHGALDDPDYFVNIGINSVWFTNEGSQIAVDGDHPYDPIYPGWAFARNAGLEGTAFVQIELWDDDDDGGSDCHSDIYTEADPDAEERSIWLNVDVVTGAISYDLIGNASTQLYSEGDDEDRSKIWFRIILPNHAPEANAGLDRTVHESDFVTLEGSFTDPDEGDTHTFLWHLESATNGQTIPDSTEQSLTFIPEDDGVYTFVFTVTDNHGAQGSDTVVVTAENVPPTASIETVADETGAKIGVDVPVALVGLVIDLAGTFDDVGLLDTHVGEIAWGDGTSDPSASFDSFSDCLGLYTGALSTSHVYAAPGSYTITLSITDDDLGVGTATFQINVVDAAGAIAAVVESLKAYDGIPNIRAAIDKLQGTRDGYDANGALDMIDKGNLNAALEKVWQALKYMEAAEADDPNLDLTYDKGLLALAAKSLTIGAIGEAEAVAFKASDLWKIQQAKTLVAEGDALLASHDYLGAVDKDREAVLYVQEIN